MMPRGIFCSMMKALGSANMTKNFELSPAAFQS
jgi:hypothetical protein